MNSGCAKVLQSLNGRLAASLGAALRGEQFHHLRLWTHYPKHLWREDGEALKVEVAGPGRMRGTRNRNGIGSKRMKFRIKSASHKCLKLLRPTPVSFSSTPSTHDDDSIPRLSIDMKARRTSLQCPVGTVSLTLLKATSTSIFQLPAIIKFVHGPLYKVSFRWK